MSNSTEQTADTTLAERYQRVRQRVASAAARAGRRPEDILLVAVTKYAEPDQIRALIELGHRDFGENRVQQLTQRAAMVDEFLERLRVLPNVRERMPGADNGPKPGDIRWHMIGHLQRNKAKRVAECCRLIHTVDSLRLAEELQQIGLKKDRVIEVLIQVNCSGEESKYGCPVPAAVPLAEQIQSMVHLRLRGLMTMAPYSENPEDARPTFIRCRELFTEMAKERYGDGRFDLLSMGMSGDFEVAIEEGANIVRVGSAIFGDRPQSEDESDDED